MGGPPEPPGSLLVDEGGVQLLGPQLHFTSHVAEGFLPKLRPVVVKPFLTTTVRTAALLIEGGSPSQFHTCIGYGGKLTRQTTPGTTSNGFFTRVVFATARAAQNFRFKPLLVFGRHHTDDTTYFARRAGQSQGFGCYWRS